jgi:hypothetical protein
MEVFLLHSWPLSSGNSCSSKRLETYPIPLPAAALCSSTVVTLELSFKSDCSSGMCFAGDNSMKSSHGRHTAWQSAGVAKHKYTVSRASVANKHRPGEIKSDLTSLPASNKLLHLAVPLPPCLPLPSDLPFPVSQLLLDSDHLVQSPGNLSSLTLCLCLGSPVVSGLSQISSISTENWSKQILPSNSLDEHLPSQERDYGKWRNFVSSWLFGLAVTLKRF